MNNRFNLFKYNVKYLFFLKKILKKMLSNEVNKLYQLRKRIYIGNIKLDEIKKILLDIKLNGEEHDYVNQMVDILDNSEIDEEQKIDKIKEYLLKS